ncbi:endopeptidase La [candidate division BRC1 bacterium HGW-BRC1-1]|jgi:ATP-dependent Lon protease|nr:MAG: endopeptidase La [candidate division BRC1 bacterium HGW-BRC1-1]
MTPSPKSSDKPRSRSKRQTEPDADLLPAIPLKDIVVFPGCIAPLFVVRPRSLAALDAAVSNDKRIFLVAQKSVDVESPVDKDLFDVGTIAEVLQVLRMPDGAAKVLVEGQQLARVLGFTDNDKGLTAFVSPLDVDYEPSRNIEALRRLIINQFEEYVKMSDKVPDELFLSIKNFDTPLQVANAIGHYAAFKTKDKQSLLETTDVEKKLRKLTKLLSNENELLELEGSIMSQVKNQIGKSQKEYFLNEQLKVIERELGITNEEDIELHELMEDMEKSKMSQEAREKVQRELGRLMKMSPMSPEATVSRTYIEWILDLPWGDFTDDRAMTLDMAQEVLDRDHFGLTKVKDRIIEYIAVHRLTRHVKGPILCLVGPPGVGKTSLARSVADSLGRKFVRISLGGVRDEAEIRGHRRTYIGSLPGKIVQSMKKAGSCNPVFLLDEVDKMSADFRGDPASALLEVLDPEQNKTFSDHYLEIDFDLSQVMFITTANTMAGIPHPLLDRMELIRLPGYTEDEKLEIAERFLVPKQTRENGLTLDHISFTRKALETIISGYTRESGVRSLEREIATICRRAAKELVQANPDIAPTRPEEEEVVVSTKKRKSKADDKPLTARAKAKAAKQAAEKEAKAAAAAAAMPKPEMVTVTPEKVRALLGPMRFKDMEITREPEIGVVTGLAWTEVGGELLPTESTVMKGRGNLVLTGKLGDVMQESAKAALSYIRSRVTKLKLPVDFHKNLDIHVHIPEGAIPKDGPSAGVTLATSMVSALTDTPVRQDIAMTGEITLRGKVLKIGGLKEKVLAAHRARIMTVIMPEENADELEEISKKVRKEMEFIQVKTLDEVLEIALVKTKPKK